MTTSVECAAKNFVYYFVKRFKLRVDIRGYRSHFYCYLRFHSHCCPTVISNSTVCVCLYVFGGAKRTFVGASFLFSLYFGCHFSDHLSLLKAKEHRKHKRTTATVQHSSAAFYKSDYMRIYSRALTSCFGLEPFLLQLH